MVTIDERQRFRLKIRIRENLAFVLENFQLHSEAQFDSNVLQYHVKYCNNTVSSIALKLIEQENYHGQRSKIV